MRWNPWPLVGCAITVGCSLLFWGGLFLLLAGCAKQERQEQRRTVIVEHRRGTEGGHPVDVRVTRREATEEQATTTTGVDPEAVGALVKAAVAQAVPGLDAIAGAVGKMIPRDRGILGLGTEEVVGGLAAAWAGERVWAIRNRRRERLEKAPKKKAAA
jgi:hypothetical protein